MMGGESWGSTPGGLPPGAQESGPLLPVHLNGFVPTVGESFTFMNYSALTGTFFIFDRVSRGIPVPAYRHLNIELYFTPNQPMLASRQVR